MAPKKPEFVGGGEGPPFKMPKAPKIPGKLTALAILAIVAIAGLAALYSMFLEYVRPNEYGIREVQIGVNRGIEDEVYGAGLHFVMPFGFQIMHRLPRNMQVLELTQVASNPHTAARGGSYVHHDKPAKIQTSDGFFVDVDASILYRIVDPYRVVTTLGTGMQYLQQGILPKAEPILKEALGTLTTEDFYNSPLRVERAQQARDRLNEEMIDKGIEVDHVLVRYFQYTDRIQVNIEEKKLQDQLVFTNQSMARAAQQEQALNRINTEGQMAVEITLQSGDAYRIRREAEKDLYARKITAEADLLIKLAEAERSRLKNDAMQVLGSDRMVAIRMAEVLRGLDMIVMPTGGEGSMNPLDLDSVLKQFGVEDYEDTSAPSEPLFELKTETDSSAEFELPKVQDLMPSLSEETVEKVEEVVEAAEATEEALEENLDEPQPANEEDAQ